MKAKQGIPPFSSKLFIVLAGVALLTSATQPRADQAKAKEKEKVEKIDKGSGIAPGRYTGASQLMQFSKDGTVSYDDRPMGICHLEVTKDDQIKISFPDPDLGRGKWKEMTLKLTGTKPRATWTTAFGNETYKVTAIPFSPKMYLFRLEHLKKGALLAGAQEFYAVELKKEK